MPHDNSIDTTSLATELTTTLEANGIDAMFQKLEKEMLNETNDIAICVSL